VLLVLPMETRGDQLLSGIKILDLTNVLAGPYCCYQLGLLGAQVIKIERPGKGDLARQLGSDSDLNQANEGISFQAQNAGKKSVTLNLKNLDGKKILHQLVASADVLVENFRPGVMDRLQLGYEELKVTNPNLIYCAISGFGQEGPWKNNPAYDQIVQGISGVMSITGDEESAPLRVGYPMADTIGGMTAAFTIAAALNAKPRGSFIDISMTEAVISGMGWVVSNHMIGGVDPAPQGNENTTSAPSGTFKTGDAPINIAANKDEQWELLANHLGREDLLINPSYATREERKKNRVALRHELEQVLMTRSSKSWVEELSKLGVPVGPVLTVPQILSAEQTVSRKLVASYPAKHNHNIDVVAAPAVINGVRPTAKDSPPVLGQDTDAILQELGLTQNDISELRQRGVI
jgi:crotonobetainyl-CoA:carnitine CoA-transferase CaiB-like acyl-CoA transferase